MPQIEPLYLRPVVGFFMWHLERQTAPEELLTRAKNKEEFAGITEAEFQLALGRAASNVLKGAQLRLKYAPMFLAADGTYTGDESRVVVPVRKNRKSRGG